MVVSGRPQYKGVSLMELLVKNGKFFMLTEKQGPKKEIRIYDEMNPAITVIKDSLKKGITSENIELLSIEIKEEKFEIKTIPWNVIATQLIKE
jgi:hypothetical protein